MDPWRLSQRRVFPVIQTPLREMFHDNISNGGFVPLISHDELVAAFLGSLTIKQKVPQRATSLFS